MTRALEYMGSDARHQNQRYPARRDLDRIVHKRPDRGPPPTSPRSSRARRSRTRLDYAMIVPGSGLVKQQAEHEGLHHIFLEAGFEWREAGCSMCLGHELPTSSSPASAAHRHPTATSKGDRATADARTLGFAADGGRRRDCWAFRGRAHVGLRRARLTGAGLAANAVLIPGPWHRVEPGPARASKPLRQ